MAIAQSNEIERSLSNSAVNVDDRGNEPMDRTVQLITALHSSLDIKHVVLQFSQGLTHQVRCEGIQYYHEESHSKVQLGRMSEHSFSYNLKAGNLSLGTIKISRTNPFSEEEVLQIEDILTLLISPLKNAVVHFKALQSARQDPLTELHNRLSLKPTLVREIKLAQRHKTALSVLAFDLDDFKNINDKFGHLAGDKVLEFFAKFLQVQVRETDLLFRTGGEEFIAILSKTDIEGASILANRICENLSNTECHYDNEVIKLTTSIGYTNLLPEDDDITILERADKALYRAKKQGKNQACR